jgi:hypothetical protein
MYQGESFHDRAANARRNQLLDIMVNSGSLAGHVLAAEERHRDARRLAAIRAATRNANARPSGAWCQRLGTYLIRAGNHLQGATPPTGVAMTGAVN